MPDKLTTRLREFASSHNFLGNKGPLCVAVVMTETAAKAGLPLDPEMLLTSKGGQVKGLSMGAVQKVLSRHGIVRILAKEAGRTSRGSIDNMREYVSLLNELSDQEYFDLGRVEQWWVEKVREFFDSSPLVLKLDSGLSVKTCIRGLVDEAIERQKQSPGSTVLGAMLQHLVGAKLEKLYPDVAFAHHGYSVADGPTSRSGDFEFGDSAIHVTTQPGRQLMEKCRANLGSGRRPIIISTLQGANFAEQLGSELGLAERIEVLDVEQFLVANVIEWTQFDGANRRQMLQELIDRYNVIVESCETDPSLRIELA